MAERYGVSKWKFLTDAVHNSYLLERLKEKSPAFFLLYGTPVPIRASFIPNYSKLSEKVKVFVEVIPLNLFSVA